MNSYYPLTYAQKRLWFEYKIAPNSVKYNLPLLFKLNGRVNIDALREAWGKVVQRHAGLRTHFNEQSNTPYQYINSSGVEAFQVIDLSDKSLTEKEAISKEIIDTLINHKFNIEHPPLWKIALIILDSTTYYLLLNFHHIIIDGHSISILLKDLSDIYNYLCFNEDSPPKINISITDYLKFEEKNLISTFLDKSKFFWKKYLNNTNFKINIPSKGIFHSSTKEEGRRIS
ncbi:MAG: hypothetical protein JNJ47_05340, partial [Alphaproteobacteria bacterium]|nr:hypothetical protein [Alphaproteobacteria bacterium]